jgi:DeoR/GlpR family transcriptional regulator of sugar metabolism
VLKEERQRRIVELVEADGRVVATRLQEVLGVSGYTVRRDLDELAQARRLQRVHGGALARSTTPVTYEQRQSHALPGKLATAQAAAKLLRPGQTVILDGGSTALLLAEHIRTGTVITHSPPVATALGRNGAEVILIGGTLDARALVATGAETIRAYRNVSADVCFLGVWAIHAEHGLSGGYFEESEVRRTMVERAGTVVGLASSEKLQTVAPFRYAPASALTHLATDADETEPFEQLGIEIVR